MTCTHHNTTEALSPYTFERSDRAPTQTFSAQKQFSQRLRGALARINARIREAIVDGKLFHEDTEALVDDVPSEVFDFPTDRAKLRGFLVWLRNQLDSEYLDIVGPDRNQFIRQAYATGLRNAQRQLGNLDVAFERRDVDELLGVPIHRSALQELYTRTFEELESVRNDVAQEVRETLVEGFTEGKGPRDIARDISERVASVGKHRSTLIARSEVMNAHSTGTLNRVDQFNDRQQREREALVSHGEWDAAMDARTCPFCRRLNGTELTTSEMRTTAVEFRGDIFRLKPPAHIQGRCGLRLMLKSEDITTPLDERLPSEISVLT